MKFNAHAPIKTNLDVYHHLLAGCLSNHVCAPWDAMLHVFHDGIVVAAAPEWETVLYTLFVIC